MSVRSTRGSIRPLNPLATGTGIATTTGAWIAIPVVTGAVDSACD